MFTVIVVPEDKLIIVDGTPLTLDFTYPSGLHAIQWYGQQGHIEWENDFNWPLSAFDATAYEDEVAPYVALWQAEKERLEKEAAAAESERIAEYGSVASRFKRLRADRDNLLMGCDRLTTELTRKLRIEETYLARKEVEVALLHLDEWAVTLCDITEAEGAPFDGRVPTEHRRGFV